VNAEFFALAFVAALNPKLLAVDLLLIENRRPRAMFLSVLFGGLTVALTIGLLDVLVFQANAINSQKNGQRERRPGPRPAPARRRRAGRDRPPARPPEDTRPGRGRAAAEAGDEGRLGKAGAG
jgi:hypothetical protein